MSAVAQSRLPVICTLITLVLLLTASQIIYVYATQHEFVSSEATIIEWAQELLLMLMAVVGAYAAVMFRNSRELFVAIAAVAAMMLIREYNNWFKTVLFSGAWQLCVLAILLPVSAWLFPRRQVFVQQFKAIMSMPPAAIGMTGLLIVLVFSRLLGRKEIWEGLMGEHFVYSVKAVMEESTELLGYSLMMAGLLSLVLYLRAFATSAQLEKLSQHSAIQR